MENIGGGMFRRTDPDSIYPRVDMDPTGNTLDAAIHGTGITLPFR